ncbi:MAG: sensor histidine kinase [Paracoccaceae bacterium]
MIEKARQYWRNMNLLLRFTTAGGAVMLAAMIIVGTWVTALIEQSVVNNTAASTALYVESFVSPLNQELAFGDELSPAAKQALVEVFDGTPLGERVISYKIWKRGGRIVHASDPSVVGRAFDPSPELVKAWEGMVTAEFGIPDGLESERERGFGIPLLEIYSPIRRVWTGEVIAVAEFYERSVGLEGDLARARWTSWLLVAATFLGCASLLFGIVRSGSQTIELQQSRLQNQVAESLALAQQNATLRSRAVNASARAAAQTDRSLRRVSADLHDGPGQNLSLIGLRLEKIVPASPEGEEDARIIRQALDTAIGEIRTISRGLWLPELENQELETVVSQAVDLHRQQTGGQVSLSYHGATDPEVGHSGKASIYRFLQEALSNAARHAGGASTHVAVTVSAAQVAIVVQDDGPGFDPGADLALRPDGGQGLAGLRDRLESIGGVFEIDAAPGQGCTLRAILPLGKGM